MKLKTILNKWIFNFIVIFLILFQGFKKWDFQFSWILPCQRSSQHNFWHTMPITKSEIATVSRSKWFCFRIQNSHQQQCRRLQFDTFFVHSWFCVPRYTEYIRATKVCIKGKHVMILIINSRRAYLTNI